YNSSMDREALDAALAVADEYAHDVKGNPDLLAVAACEAEGATLLVITYKRIGEEKWEDALYEAEIRAIREHPGCQLDFSVRTIPSPVKSEDDLKPYLPTYPLRIHLNLGDANGKRARKPGRAP